MAAFCLADGARRPRGAARPHHRRRRRASGSRSTAADLKADGRDDGAAKDAIKPNLVQTLEGSPALVHGGPFANIAHGCNSVAATRAALKLADYVVTEAGFGADLGAEKFFDIKCRKAGLKPAAAVVVATVRALKMHGGAAKEALGGREPAARLQAGLANLERHIDNMRKFGVPVVVAINRFNADTDGRELDFVSDAVMGEFGVKAIVCDHWARGGAGAEDLAHAVSALADGGAARLPSALPRCHEPLGQDARHRARDLRRRGPRGVRRGAGAVRASSRRLAGATCRSASPRRNIRSPTTRRSSARRAGTCRPCARCGCAPAPASSSC